MLLSWTHRTDARYVQEAMNKPMLVDPHHWMDADGAFPKSAPLRAKAVRVAQCIEYAAALRDSEARATLVPCRSGVEAGTCDGFLLVIKQPDDSILAMCDTCQQEEFLIQNWHGTPWARGPQQAVHVDETIAMEDEPVRDVPHEASDGDAQLAAALARFKCNVSVAEVRALMAASETPADVLAQLQSRLPTGATERLMPALMHVWANTPRAELDGVTPHEQAHAKDDAPASQPMPTALCPCGSGKYVERCCITKAGIN